ncbi:glutamine--fructose-6-phosphate transaminase (isomerizing) [Fusarium falciforme]|nr:glutamine--fructose-6-phosphate transaminase (isomerizing) [Fusarium falciforme]
MDVNFVEVEYLDQEEDYLKLNTQTKSSGNVLAAAPKLYNFYIQSWLIHRNASRERLAATHGILFVIRLCITSAVCE